MAEMAAYWCSFRRSFRLGLVTVCAEHRFTIIAISILFVARARFFSSGISSILSPVAHWSCLVCQKLLVYADVRSMRLEIVMMTANRLKQLE